MKTLFLYQELRGVSCLPMTIPGNTQSLVQQFVVHNEVGYVFGNILVV